MRRFLTPRWLLVHLGFVLLVVIMVNLGLWQLRRLDERRAYNELVRSRAGEPALSVDDVDARLAGGTALADLRFRTVEVDGTYLTDPVFRLVVDAQQHDEIGLLELADGRVVVVDRGTTPQVSPVKPTAGTVRLTGRLEPASGKGTGQLAGATSPIEIYRLDAGEIGDQIGKEVLPFTLDRIESTPADGPLEVVPMPDLGEGPHLGYAVQWFLFSLGAVVLWVMVIARAVNERQEADAVAAGASPTPIEGDPW